MAEIKGQLISRLPMQLGQGKNGEWVKRAFVIETDGPYPKKVLITAWGDKGQPIASAKQGAMITVQYDLESRQNERKPDQWFTEVKAFKIEIDGEQPVQQPKAQRQNTAPARRQTVTTVNDRFNDDDGYRDNGANDDGDLPF